MTDSFRCIDPSELGRKTGYRLLTSMIVPRPIGFAATCDEQGTTNLAPFSFFGGVSANPPIVYLSVGQRAGEEKDTLKNLRATGDVVIHIATEDLAEAVNQAAGDYPPDVSEIDVCGLTPVSSEVVRPPRIAESPIAMEGRVIDIIDSPGGAPVGMALIRIERFHVDESVLDEEGFVDPEKLRAIGRLGGSNYCKVRDLFQMVRPKIIGQ